MHFTATPLRPLYNCEQNAMNWMKPRGLWVSDEEQADAWLRWVDQEGGKDFRQRCKHAYYIDLAKGHNVLIIDNFEELLEFSHTFRMRPDDWPDGMADLGRHVVYLSWPRIAQDYQGVIVTPYQWDARFDHRTNWYYGWDVASGCIWDVAAIKSVEQTHDIQWSEE